jgi:hypothetical protein
VAELFDLAPDYSIAVHGNFHEDPLCDGSWGKRKKGGEMEFGTNGSVWNSVGPRHNLKHSSSIQLGD